MVVDVGCGIGYESAVGIGRAIYNHAKESSCEG